MQFGFMLLPRDLDETRATARLGEELGFSWMGIADSPTVYEESYLHQLEAARATTTLRVGPMASHVVARHPVIIGNLLATLHEFTGGRAVGTLATGNSAARGLGLKPAPVDQLGQAIEAIRSYWRGEGGKLWNSEIPATGLAREAPDIIVAADGPRAAELAGRVGDGLLYGGTIDAEVRRRRLDAGRPHEHQQAWIAPTVSLAETQEGVREDLGAMVVAMANRAMRGDLDERGVPPEIQDDVRRMREAYDYGFHADSSRPRNVEVVSSQLASYLIDTLCVWGNQDRWAQTLSEFERDGWTGVMFILGQAKQLEVVRALGERLTRIGMLRSRAAASN